MTSFDLNAHDPYINNTVYALVANQVSPKTSLSGVRTPRAEAYAQSAIIQQDAPRIPG